MDAAVFKALSDPNRLRIIELLKNGEMCACNILPELGVTQPTLSHHMSVLQSCGIVSVRKSGQWSHYSLVPETLAELTDFFESLKKSVNDSSKPIVPE